MTLEEVLDYFADGANKRKRISLTAQALGISYQAVSQWKEVPEAQQWRIQHMSDGALSVDEKYQISNGTAA